MNPDAALFRLLNSGAANPVYDAVMPFVTRGDIVQHIIVVCLLSLVAFAHLRGDRESVRAAWCVLLATGLGVALGELIGSNVLKPLVGRPRPPLALGDSVRLLVSLGPSYSFPSAHAINSAAFGAAVASGFPRLRWPALGFASLIAFSRVYVGVHYPLDVLAGAALGLGLGSLLYSLLRRARG